MERRTKSAPPPLHYVVPPDERDVKVDLYCHTVLSIPTMRDAAVMHVHILCARSGITALVNAACVTVWSVFPFQFQYEMYKLHCGAVFMGTSPTNCLVKRLLLSDGVLTGDTFVPLATLPFGFPVISKTGVGCGGFLRRRAPLGMRLPIVI